MEYVDTSPPSEPKLCINCKFVATAPSGDSSKYRCFAPQNRFQIDLVTGDKIYTTPYCVSHRTAAAGLGSISCTEVGYWYEPKPVHPVYDSIGLAEVTPAQLAAKIANAKATKQHQNPGTNLLKELGL